MYQRNETHAFVEKYFVEADHKYLRQTALEKKREEKIMEYQQLQVEQKRKKEKEANARSDAKAAQLEKVALIFDKNTITNLKGQKLLRLEQVNAFYHFGAPLGLWKDIGAVADKRIALKLAIDEYNSNKWVPKSKSASEGEDGNAGNVDVDEEEEE